MELYEQLTSELNKSFKTPFCGNIMSHYKRHNRIIGEIREKFTEEEALAFEMSRCDEQVARARVFNIYHSEPLSL